MTLFGSSQRHFLNESENNAREICTEKISERIRMSVTLYSSSRKRSLDGADNAKDRCKMDVANARMVGGLIACCRLTEDTPRQLVYRETRMLPLSDELKLGSEQLAIDADLNRRRPTERSSGDRPRTSPLGCVEAVQKKNHTLFVNSYLSNHYTHPILGKQPPPLNEANSP
uniref:Uncharacterized protein n=1 Tax=Caenorhabditis japonica TaxID=281687 RepID=A0A8R1IWJ2_CAEJA